MLKKRFPEHKFGHAGTLDPLAEGLLIILVDKETKRQNEFLIFDKEYETVARLGIKTDTLDLEGKIVEKKEVFKVDKKAIEKTLKKLLGCKKYKVPLFSATKVDGVPLYKYARAGKVPKKIPKKEMCLYEFDILDIDCKDGFCDVHLRYKVSSGSFVRTLNEELGKLLKLPSTTAYIKRTKIGPFKLKDATKVEKIDNLEKFSLDFLK